MRKFSEAVFYAYVFLGTVWGVPMFFLDNHLERSNKNE